MRQRLTRGASLVSTSCVGDGNQDRLEVPECPDDDNCDEEEEKESLSGAN